MYTKPTTFVITDLETTPDYNLLGDMYEEGKFPPPLACEIRALSAAILNQVLEDGEFVYEMQSLSTASGSEKNQLQALSDYTWKKKNDFCIVGHNSHSFDVQVLIHRSLKNGVSFPALYKTGNKFDGPLKRYDTTRHLDLCDMLSNFGASPKISLDLYVRAIGMPGKIGIDGSDVEKLCNEGKLQVVQDYCECDVAQTTALFLRTQRLRGELSAAGFLKSARNFLDFLSMQAETKQHIRELLTRIDIDVFLNAGPQINEEGSTDVALTKHSPNAHDESRSRGRNLRLVKGV